MTHRAMQNKLNRGDAKDIGDHQREGEYIVLPAFDQDLEMDYCDYKAERWIWSIGRRKSDGTILASFTPDLYQNPNFECLWLR